MQAETTEQYSNIIRAAAKRHQRYASVIGFMKGFFMAASLIGLFPLLIWLSFSMGNMFGPKTTYASYIFFLLLYGAFFLIPFFLCVPVAIFLSLKQKNTARILIFRKFNNNASGKALSQIIRSGLSKYGHTFTLADSNFKIPWYVRIPFIQGQLSFFHFRQIIINRKSRLADFKHKIKQKTWLNINWLLSADKVFAVRSSDEFWQQTAGILLATSDLILFDVSVDSTHMTWEMEQSIQHNLGHKIVAICANKNKAAVVAWAEKFKNSFQTPMPLFFYNDKGQLLDKKGFDNCVVDSLSQSYLRVKLQAMPEWPGPLRSGREAVLQQPEDLQQVQSADSIQEVPPGRYAIMRTLKLLVVTVFFIGLILFFVSPYLSPPFTASHSPFPQQAVTAFIQCAKTELDSSRLKRLANDIHRSWPARAARFSVEHALDHYEEECQSVVFALGELADYSQYQRYKQLVTDADPYVASMAAQLVGSMHHSNDSLLPFAFQLLRSPCLDTRLNAIKILSWLPLNAATTDSMLGISAIAPVYEKASNHKTTVVNLPGRKSDQISIDPQNEDDYYVQFFELLKNSIESRHRNQLQTLSASLHLRTRIFASLLLAQLNDGRAVPVLIDALCIKHEEVRNILSFGIPFTVYPYVPAIDVLLGGLTQPEYKPPVDSFLVRFNYPGIAHFSDSVKKNHALVSLLLFVVQQYSFDESKKVIEKIPEDAPLQFADALDSLYRMNNAGLQQRVIAFTRMQGPLLQQNLYNYKLSVRLKSAWLLARTGSPEIIKPVVDIANIFPFKDLFSTKKQHPNTAEALDILELLAANIKTGYNSAALITLQEDAQPELHAVLTTLIRKGRGK
ncbi:MAG: HEAT repeat domain-containing protein [Chitinophagaceae bacterium]